MSSLDTTKESVNGTGEASWRQLLDRHLIVLKEHLSVWNALEDQPLPDIEHHGAIQTCRDQTQDMINNFQKLHMSFVHKRELSSSKITNGAKRRFSGEDGYMTPSNAEPDISNLEHASFKRPRNEMNVLPPALQHLPVKDASGLFSIDTSSTPIEQLQTSKAAKRAEIQLKRKLSSTGLHAIGLSIPLHELPQPQKRPRNLEVNAGVSHNLQPRAVSTDTQQADEDEFLAKVQQRHQEKEMKRQKKVDKKRKRESNTSTEDLTSGHAKSHQKKQKKNGSAPAPNVKESNKSKKRKAAEAKKPGKKRKKN